MTGSDKDGLEWTGERYLPEVQGEIAMEHLHRYLLAKELARGKTVLDIASGEGYGSNMLADVAERVFGVDLSREAVKHASRTYRKSNLEFLIGSCADIPLPDHSIDLIVSFETIEHHDQHEEMLREFKRVLRPGGTALISSPEKYEYSIVPDFANPYHVKELYRHQFTELMARYFGSVALYGQRILYASGILPESQQAGGVACQGRGNLDGSAAPGIPKPLYLIALASDGTLPELAGSLFEDSILESQTVKNYVAALEGKDSQIRSLQQAEQASEEQIVELHLSVGERDKQIETFTAALAEREAQIDRLELAVTEREGQIGELYLAIGERDRRIEAFTRELAERGTQTDRLELAVAERDGQIGELYLAVGERDQRVESLVLEVAERDTQIDRLKLAVAERDGQIGELYLAVGERDRRVESLMLEVGGRDAQIGEMQRSAGELQRVIGELQRSVDELHQAVGERDRQIENLNLTLADRNGQIETLYMAIGDRDRRIATLLASKSWKLTAPFRFARRQLAADKRLLVRKLFSDAGRGLWRQIPIPVDKKTWLKNQIFVYFPAMFRWSATYKSWQQQQQLASAPALELLTDGCDIAEAYSIEDEYVPKLSAPPLLDKTVRLIAFYLPQYHPIPENDMWWGEGFTEWTNVRPAQPQFIGHYQPRVPGELGYYNLLDPVVQRSQIELAKLYGIEGFCFYFYWFGGKRLLEAPLQNYLNDPSLDQPYCLCWANENWSRRWDGLDKEILIAQQHSAADDLAFIAYISAYLQDPRYIRVNGKPLLVVYRPSLLPSAEDTAQRWRGWCRDNGVGEIYLAYTQSFEIVDPAKIGFDAAIEFPPNNSAPRDITHHVKPISGNFAGTVYDWKIFIERSYQYEAPSYPLFRSVCPAWDNTARRKNCGTVFLNSSPALYRTWLENAIQDTKLRFAPPDERLVFINAWNEWAEGAHLEPDQKHGYAFLAATREALQRTAKTTAYHRKLIVVSHDAFPAGAQFLALGMIRALVQETKLAVHTVLLDSGSLEVEFEKLSPLSEIFPGPHFEQRARAAAAELKSKGFNHAILNTTLSGKICPIFTEAGIRCVSLIHELPGIIQRYGLEQETALITRHAQGIVFPAEIVREGFAQFTDVPPERSVILPQGVWRRNLWRYQKAKARTEVRKRLGLADDALIVLAVGYADRRKGADLFVQAALQILERNDHACFVWIGHWEHSTRQEVDRILQDSGKAEAFRFLGYDPETAIYHAGADVYALPSREDPFPNVVLESFDAGVPVVAFADTGGGSQLVSRIGGKAVPGGDVAAFADALLDIATAPATAARLGRQAMEYVDSHHSFGKYIFDLCGICGIALPRVSVVVPNYNYGRYLKARLDSIHRQTVPIYEIIILDDASTDASVEVILDWLASNGRMARLDINEANAGNVFAQWHKGVSLATGDFIWIAEADDLCKENFLEILLAPMMADRETVISYCDSQQIDEHGNKLDDNYQQYLAEVSPQRWRTAYVREGREEIENAMAVMNTIPNVSGALFRREAIAAVLDSDLAEITQLPRAGDWLAYVKMLAKGKIAYNPTAANIHRRHTGSVIGAAGRSPLVDEIKQVQHYVATQFNPPPETQKQAAAYLQKLRQQFSLAEEV